MRGRTVMVYDRPDGELVQVFQVGVEDMPGVIRALLEERPDLDALHIVVDGIIDRTSAAYMELGPGEVRSAAVTSLSASRSMPPSPSH